MKRAGLTLSILLASSVLAAGLAAAPRMTIPVTEFDFGYSPQNAAISHVFWLHSTGEDTLKIVKVVPGCGCTQTPLSKYKLAPGDSTELEVIFSTGGYISQVTKAPKIQTNEGPPDKIVRISTNVLTKPDSTYPIVLKPYLLDLSDLTLDKNPVAKFTITNNSSQLLEPTMIASPTPWLDVTLPKKIPAGKSAVGTVRIKAEFADRSFGKSFTFQLNDEKKTRFTVPVTRTVAANKLAVPVPDTPAKQH